MPKPSDPLPSEHEATRLLAELGEGHPTAADRLLPLVYAELRALAARHLRRERSGHTLQTTALVNEAWLRMVQHGISNSRTRAQFFALAAQAIRRVLVDHARRRRSGKRGGAWSKVALDDSAAAALDSEHESGIDILALDEALDRLASYDERQSRVVELRFFAGLSVEEIAHALGVSARTIKGDWNMARAFLRQELT